MLYKLYTKHFYIILFFISLWPNHNVLADSGGIDIRGFTLESDTKKEHQANMFVEFRLSDDMKNALTHGVQLKASIYFTLGKHRSWWWNAKNNLPSISYNLKYHALTKHYVLTRLDEKQHWTFSTLGAALQQMGRVINHPLPTLKNISPDDNHYLFIQARVAAQTLKLPLKIQSYFNKKYKLESEGILWSLP